jgi:hypothetical protein
MNWPESSSDYVLWGLGVLAHLICLAGIVIALRTSRRTVSFRFAVAGLFSVLALGLAAWWFYRNGLTLTDQGVERASDFNRGMVKMAGIHVSQINLTLCLYFAIVPLLTSVGLLVRGLMLDPDPGPVGAAWRPVLAVVCLVAGAGLLGIALLDYLNVGPFLRSMILWIT